jgi:hypothetical protein
VGPVHLALLARQRSQAQERLGGGRGPVAGDGVAKVVGVADVAALAAHVVEAAGAQPPAQ